MAEKKKKRRRGRSPEIEGRRREEGEKKPGERGKEASFNSPTFEYMIMAPGGRLAQR